MANGVAYGFVNLQNIFDQRVTQVDVRIIEGAIQRTLEEHNRQLDAFMNMFAGRTTDYKAKFRGVVRKRLQPLTEDGTALPTTGGTTYDLAWPIMMAGDAFGLTWLALQEATVAEINKMVLEAQLADITWMRDQQLAALYTNVDWAFTDKKWGSLTVKPLANGDGYVYGLSAGATTAADDTHHLAQANAIDSSNDPIDDIAEELREHPENAGDVVIFTPTNLKDAIAALPSFVAAADSVVTPGNASDRVTFNRGISLPDGTALPGELIGYHKGARAYIVHWKSMVSSYLIGTMTDSEKPLLMREDSAPSLRGFQLVALKGDHPYYERQWMRRAGFGANNRVGAVVMRIGNGSYAIPSGYTAPVA